MLTKRGFIAGAAASTAVAATGQWRTALSREPGPALDLVVFNDRYADARRFAAALGTDAIPTLPVSGDPATLWYGALSQLIADGKRRIAGMGTSMDLFILETLARDTGLRVRFRACHDCRGRRCLTHSFHTQSRDPPVARAVEFAGAGWPLALAASLSQSEVTANLPLNHSQLCTTVERSPDHPGMLVSWVLA